MSTEEKQSTEEKRSSDEAQSPEPRTDEAEERPPTDKPEVTDEHKEKASKMREAYEEDRETIKMPGTDGAVAGTAINDWIDDDGNPKFSDKDKKD